MERLTFEGNFCDIAQCGDLVCQQSGTCTQRQVWERLKAYEDIAELCGGFDRLRELAEADKDGRVVVLPCKVGDVVYGFHGEKTILPMVAKWIETNTDGWCIAVQYTPMAPRFYRFSDFGKTVFLTREEAKKALQEMEGKG